MPPRPCRGFPNRKDLHAELEKKLNYTFRNSALLQEALNHSSYANEHRSAHLHSNERLGSWGFGAWFCNGGVSLYPASGVSEEDLTRIRAALVCGKSP